MKAAGRLDPARMVSTTIPLSGVGNALRAMDRFQNHGVTGEIGSIVDREETKTAGYPFSAVKRLLNMQDFMSPLRHHAAPATRRRGDQSQGEHPMATTSKSTDTGKSGQPQTPKPAKDAPRTVSAQVFNDFAAI